MRREIDSTISVTTFFILAALTALVFSGCGRRGANEPLVNRPDIQPRGCGYQFDLEQNQTTLKGQLSILAGIWKDNYTVGYTVVRVNGTDLQQKAGFEFDFVAQIYGELSIRYSSVDPLMEDSIAGPPIKYDALRISTPLTGVGDGTYRALETYLADKTPSYNTCRTQIYKIIDGDNIAMTPGKFHFVVGKDAVIPNIREYVKEITANPDSFKFTRHQ